MKKLTDLTTDQIRCYFTSRLPDARFKADSPAQIVKCCFHSDSQPSLSINFEKGVFNCHAGCGKGGLKDFEKLFSSCDDRTATQNIFEVLGIKQAQQGPLYDKPEKVYDYTDENGRLLSQKLRFPGKRFVQRKPTSDGGWDYHLGTCRKVLYHLPEVVTANSVGITEGEKDADNLRDLNLGQFDKRGLTRFATTTNFDGAGKWRPEYSPFLTGKNVLIFPDNDEPGKRHAKMVAESVYPYAQGVRVVELPGLTEHGDLSDYLEHHTPLELIEWTKKTALWAPVKSALLIPAQEFIDRSTAAIDWLVDGIIQRGGNGFIVSHPKAGKSWQAVDLALSLALGVPWMEFNIFHPERVALISREDNPALTAWRMRNLLMGKHKALSDLGDRLYVNSKDQSPQFKLDVPEQLSEMMAALRQLKPDFVILDVLNVMHSVDENDNTEMRRILDCAEIINRELRCSICILHHFNKEKEGRLTEKMRGSSAIAGFAEWIIGIRMQSNKPDERVRIMEFDTKASAPHAPIKYTINGDADSREGLTVQRYTEPEETSRKRVN